MMILCSVSLTTAKLPTSPPLPTISTQTQSWISKRKTRKIPDFKFQRFLNYDLSNVCENQICGKRRYLILIPLTRLKMPVGHQMLRNALTASFKLWVISALPSSSWCSHAALPYFSFGNHSSIILLEWLFWPVSHKLTNYLGNVLFYMASFNATWHSIS